MNAVRRKLNSTRGVSVIFALLFLLVATMVSIVILNASVTTTKRLRDDTVWEQDNLTLTSAGNLLRDCISGTSCTVTTVTDLSTDASETTVTASGPMSDILRGALTAVNNSGRQYDGSFTLSPDDSSGVFKTVTVSYTIMPDQAEIASIDNEQHRKDSYKISATLSLEGSDQKLFITGYRSITQSPPETNDGIHRTRTDDVEWTSVILSTKEGVE